MDSHLSNTVSASGPERSLSIWNKVGARVTRTLRLKPASDDTLASLLASSKLAKEASAVAPLPGLSGLLGILVSVLESVQVRMSA